MRSGQHYGACRVKSFGENTKSRQDGEEKGESLKHITFSLLLKGPGFISTYLGVGLGYREFQTAALQ